MAVHVVGEVTDGDLRARNLRALCGERVPWVGPGYVHKLTGLVDEAELARWLEQVTCTACKAALVQDALESLGEG